MNKDILIGKSTEHLLIDDYSQLMVHKKMILPLNSLRDAARINGFSLEIASAFRSFEEQLKIWNAKALGQRTVYNEQNIALDISLLTPKELVFAILRWSALPGASRHHWGTDIDVYDKNVLSTNYKVQLLPSETTPDGIFGNFHIWLDHNLKQYGFYRPYELDTGGIAPERWHLSYAPISDIYQNELNYEYLLSLIEKTDIELKDTILMYLPEIFSRFINI